MPAPSPRPSRSARSAYSAEHPAVGLRQLAPRAAQSPPRPLGQPSLSAPTSSWLLDLELNPSGSLVGVKYGRASALVSSGHSDTSFGTVAPVGASSPPTWTQTSPASASCRLGALVGQLLGA